jgi:hypothetical protein
MSAVFFVLGLIAAAQRKRWLLMASYVAFLVSIPLLLYALIFISDDRLRMWLGFPLIGLSFPWIMSGMAFYGMATNSSDNLHEDKKYTESMQDMQRRGYLHLLFGASVWLIGFFVGPFVKIIEVIVVAVSTYSLTLGLIWVAINRKP